MSTEGSTYDQSNHYLAVVEIERAIVVVDDEEVLLPLFGLPVIGERHVFFAFADVKVAPVTFRAAVYVDGAFAVACNADFVAQEAVDIALPPHFD